jgi:multimeric flavodoxin WrbA
MARILVLYYSSYGHLARMADAVAEGVRNSGHECDVRRVAETAPPEVAAAAGFVADHTHPEIEGINALPQYDGIVIGAPTRFVRGGSPYGATTIANNDGSRLPSEVDLNGARYLGRRVAETAAKLSA